MVETKMAAASSPESWVTSVRIYRRRLNQVGSRNPAAEPLQQAIAAVNAAESRALKGVVIDAAELTKLKEVVGNAEVAISRQLEILVAKENARSVQEDAAPEGYTKPVAEYFKGLANQNVAQKPQQ
jgi:hypothetical protein